MLTRQASTPFLVRQQRQTARHRVADELSRDNATIALQLLKSGNLGYRQSNGIRHHAFALRARPKRCKTLKNGRARGIRFTNWQYDRKLARSLYRRSVISDGGNVSVEAFESVCGEGGTFLSHDRISLVSSTYSFAAVWLGA